MTFELTDRTVVSVSGPEARDFLQGLVTNDATRVTPEQPVYAALLTPQGKILFDFLIGEHEGALLIDCQQGARDSLVKRLTMYKLRAKVEIRPRDDLVVIWGEGTADPRLAALGPRTVQAKASVTPGDEAYLARRLELGVPEGEDFGSDRMFSLDAGLDELHAVSFDKGCYVGQELTARMKHRGTDRKRLLPVATADGNLLPGRDVPVKAGETEIGTLSAAYGPRGFALIRLDRLEAAPGPLTADGVPLTVTKPDWLFT